MTCELRRVDGLPYDKRPTFTFADSPITELNGQSFEYVRPR